MLQVRRSQVWPRWHHWIFSIYLILPATLCPGVYSATNRNGYQKQKKKNLESRVWPVCKADNLTTSVSQLSRQCGIFNISQPYRPSWPVIGKALLFYFYFINKLNYPLTIRRLHKYCPSILSQVITLTHLCIIFSDERYRLLSSIPPSWFLISSFGVLVISSRLGRWHPWGM
jgi:hypothetical protein